MNWKEIMKADKICKEVRESTPNRYKMGYLLCANNCIRAVEEKGRSGPYCAYCGDDGDYQIPPPRGFKFDERPPPFGEYKTAPLGFKEPWISDEQRKTAQDNYDGLHRYTEGAKRALL